MYHFLHYHAVNVWKLHDHNRLPLCTIKSLTVAPKLLFNVSVQERSDFNPVKLHFPFQSEQSARYTWEVAGEGVGFGGLITVDPLN